MRKRKNSTVHDERAKGKILSPYSRSTNDLRRISINLYRAMDYSMILMENPTFQASQACSEDRSAQCSVDVSF